MKNTIKQAWRNAVRANKAGDYATYFRVRRDLQGLTGRSAKDLDLALT
jgi:hypothetical protein